ATTSARARRRWRHRPRSTQTQRARRWSPCASVSEPRRIGGPPNLEATLVRCSSRTPPKGGSMGLGVGLILSAVGAVLAFAVNKPVNGVDIHTIGWILLIVGIVGILLSLIFWSSWAGPGGWSRRRTTYYDEGPAGPAGPAGPPY